jgi:subtilisin family serine protease
MHAAHLQVSISAGDLSWGGDVSLKGFFSNLYNSGDFLIFAAAGNAGTSGTSLPAGFNSVISVAAVDSSRSRASFSNFNADVELTAPGAGPRLLGSSVPGGRAA